MLAGGSFLSEGGFQRSHGGASLGLEDGLLDFSVNLNYYGPSERMVLAIQKEDFSQYPEDTSRALREKIALKYGCKKEEILVGNGATQILWQLARYFAPFPSMVVEPTFSEFAAALESYGAYPSRPFLHQVEGVLDKEKFRDVLKKSKPKVCYFCNPNSPTGHYVDHKELMALFKDFPETTFILDQAFLPLSPFAKDMHAKREKNVFLLRSLTKDHAIAGLRLGYLIAPSKMCDYLSSHRPYWSVNRLAQRAGEVALEDTTFLEESMERIFRDKASMVARLREAGFRVFDGCTPFFLVKCEDASYLKGRLLEKGILVRDGSSYKLYEWVRLCARPKEKVDILLAALKEACHVG